MSRDVRLALCCAILGAMLGWGLCSICLDAKSGRPVFRFVARAAATVLWFLSFSEQPPEDTYHQRTGPDGYATINHGDTI